MSDLRSCPFCGDEVTISYQSENNVFAVWHKNKSCEFLEPLYIDGKYAKSLLDAQRIWNRQKDDSAKETIRCKNCRYYIKETYKCCRTKSYVYKENFCGNGERIDNKTD